MTRRSKKKRLTVAEDFMLVLKSQKDEECTKFLKAELEKSNVEELSQEKNDDLWAIVQRIFEYHSEKIFSKDPTPDGVGVEEPEQPSGDKTVTDDVEDQTEESIKFVYSVINKMKAVVATTEPHISAKMFDIMISLQSFLIPTGIDSEQKLENEIVNLIELWWVARLEIKASMILLAFMFLLKRTSATAKNVLKLDVTRVWKFRESLLKLNLESDGCVELVQKLSVLPENKYYLRSKDGCNFIAFLFTLNDELVVNLHASVKRALPKSNRKNVDAYGQIYTTAWIKGSPDIRKVVEEVCVQNFMLHALTLQRQVKDMSRLGQHVLVILNHFHCNRVHPLMRKMLATQYEPLLWRFLWSSNNLHRCNASQVFFSAYPLKCPGAGAEARTLYEDKQHQAISTMLTDSCHIVRIIATKEVFKVMELYWQILSPECVQGWMKTIVSELAGDSSCADVRRQVFLGFTHLLNNPLSVDYVKDIVPKLQMQIHDVNEKVRLAFVKLLLKLKALNMHYWSFVPLRHIMARLEVENKLIGEQLVSLTVDGFYGPQKTVDQKIRRLMGLFILNHGAGRNFFYYSKPSLNTEDAVDLCIIVLKTLKSFVKMCVEQDKTIDNSTCGVSDSPSQELKKGKVVQDKENIDTVNTSSGGPKKSTNINNSVSLDNPVVLQGFIDLVGILWTIHIKDLSKTQTMQLESLCVDCMPSFTSFFQGTHFYSSVLFLASLAPNKALSERYHINSMFMSQLKHLTPDDTDEVFSALVQPLCSWNQGSPMLDIVQESLHEAWISQTSSKNSTGRRLVTFRVVLQTKPVAALKILDSIFSYQPNQMKIVSKNYNQLLELWTDMSQIKDVVVTRVVQGTPLESHLLSDTFLQGCLLRYAKLILILKKDNVDFDYLEEFMNLLEWARESLIPHVPAELPPKGSVGVPLVVSLLRDLVYVATNMVVLCSDEPKLCMRIAAFSMDLIKSGCGLMFVHSVSLVIGQLLELCKQDDEVKDPMKLLRVVTPSLMTAVLSALSRSHYPVDYITSHVENVSQVKSVMTDLLETYQKLYGTSSTLLQCVVGKFGDAVLSIYTQHLQQTTDDAPLAKSIQNLPYAACLAATIFVSHNKLADLFIENLRQRLVTFTEDDTEFMALTSLLDLLRAKATILKNRASDQTPPTVP